MQANIVLTSGALGCLLAIPVTCDLKGSPWGHMYNHRGLTILPSLIIQGQSLLLYYLLLHVAVAVLALTLEDLCFPLPVYGRVDSRIVACEQWPSTQPLASSVSCVPSSLDNH